MFVLMQFKQVVEKQKKDGSTYHRAVYCLHDGQGTVQNVDDYVSSESLSQFRTLKRDKFYFLSVPLRQRATVRQGDANGGNSYANISTYADLRPFVSAKVYDFSVSISPGDCSDEAIMGFLEGLAVSNSPTAS